MNKQVLRFNISMTNSERVNICESPKTLVCIKFDEDHWDFFFALIIVFQDSEYRFLHVIHHYIQIYLVFFITLSVERMS
jgi:hypothetical protein